MRRKKDVGEILCLTHGTVTAWKALDEIQRQAFEDKIDTAEDLPCVLDPSRHRDAQKKREFK